MMTESKIKGIPYRVLNSDSVVQFSRKKIKTLEPCSPPSKSGEAGSPTIVTVGPASDGAAIGYRGLLAIARREIQLPELLADNS